ncbi:MAG: DEAD/DEAH box helicase family protein, partial [Thermoguttaceae bacterium]|nr:DEAD/DEAH box helicase family protein [Thermoguttaceae bacterium]
AFEYQIDPGRDGGKFAAVREQDGYANAPIRLNDERILENLRNVQRRNGLKESPKLEGRYNLTVEMETGVGKTYTYTKTIYELNKRYGWTKFIVVVPSVAIREGVAKSFAVTQEHFAEEYDKKIRFFIYNSLRLNEITNFATSEKINVMIVNAQAFNVRGKDARRIYMELDEFQSRRPIDVLSRTNPILIIDEPQSVEGKQTKERLKEFRPLFTLRYSATHKSDSLYNMVFRLDAMDAYNRRLVKKIAVKGVSVKGSTGTEGYVYFEGLNLSKKAPTASIQFDGKGKNGLVVKRVAVGEGCNLYEKSGGLDEYRDGYVVKTIDGRDGSLEFVNGLKLYPGDVVGKRDEEQLRRIQIRETILSHVERERKLFQRGIKVLSLFFIDEVAKYRRYEDGAPEDGIYAQMFDEEYRAVVENFQPEFGEEDYVEYLRAIPVEKTRVAYFSVDKKTGRISNPKANKEGISDDDSAYELSMKNKEALLDRDPNRSPARFIFSHSALCEGWDNPNVFQICTLKQSASYVRKRQEIGRGLRLCVNEKGERMDASTLGDETSAVNVLTVVASESYEEFTKGLQSEIAEALTDRPRVVDPKLFEGRSWGDAKDKSRKIDVSTARKIYNSLLKNDYVDDDGALTDRYFDDKTNDRLQFSDAIAELAPTIVEILDDVVNRKTLTPENARDNNVVASLDRTKFESKEFQELWERVRPKSYYTVAFDSDELIKNAISALQRPIKIAPAFLTVEEGALEKIESKATLETGSAFVKSKNKAERTTAMETDNNVKYDLVGRLVAETGLTRKTIVAILTGINQATFDYFRWNPEEFIAKAGALINEAKATVIVQRLERQEEANNGAKNASEDDVSRRAAVRYRLLDDKFESEIFTEPALKGRLNVNARKAKKCLYDHILYDSDVEIKFAEALETAAEVQVYVKLPRGFYISTPVGKYNPDWALVLRDEAGETRQIYFVAETKGALSSLELREVEKMKIECARRHFKTLGAQRVIYDAVDSFENLRKKIFGLNEF